MLTFKDMREGTVDIPGVLRAANQAGAKLHFIEDEFQQSVKQVPRRSLE